jgi:RHS repeat-associated protein
VCGATVECLYSYEPFGALTGEKTPGFHNPLMYMGREYDRTTGLYYVRNRWYDPAVGRFISEDPIGLAGGINVYVYAGNSPTHLRDPMGLSPDKEQQSDCVAALKAVKASDDFIRRACGGGLQLEPVKIEAQRTDPFLETMMARTDMFLALVWSSFEDWFLSMPGGTETALGWNALKDQQAECIERGQRSMDDSIANMQLTRAQDALNAVGGTLVVWGILRRGGLSRGETAAKNASAGAGGALAYAGWVGRNVGVPSICAYHVQYQFD